SSKTTYIDLRVREDTADNIYHTEALEFPEEAVILPHKDLELIRNRAPKKLSTQALKEAISNYIAEYITAVDYAASQRKKKTSGISKEDHQNNVMALLGRIGVIPNARDKELRDNLNQ